MATWRACLEPALLFSGRLRPDVRHCCRCRVRVLPPASSPPFDSLSRGRFGGARAAVQAPEEDTYRDARERPQTRDRAASRSDRGRAGCGTSHDRLASRARGARAPSTSTIRRILHQAGLIVPEPRKRPRSSYIRFQAAQPNEMWQSDFIHWRLEDGTDIEILNWLDDHSRTYCPVAPINLSLGMRW